MTSQPFVKPEVILEDIAGNLIKIENLIEREKQIKQEAEKAGVSAGAVDLDLDALGYDHYSETIAERLFRNIASGEEVLKIERLFRDALPERPDLMVILGQAVINRLTVYELPYAEVPADLFRTLHPQRILA